MKSIVLISSGQPSLNPRLVKEADALVEAGFTVTVIYQYWNEWGTAFDKQILPLKKWKVIRVGGSPNEKKAIYIFSKILLKIVKTLYGKIGDEYFLPEASISRTSLLLIKVAKKIKADLYIGHNLGALPATVLAAKFNKAKCGFDAEDFHRQEISDNQSSQHHNTVKYLEDKYFPKLNYLTTASPLIAKWYKELYPSLNPKVINNVFSSKHIVLSNSLSNDQTLNLFWFSQTIGKNRGIEDAIVAIGVLKNANIKLNLLGLVNPSEKVYFQTCAHQSRLELNQLIFLEPVQPDNIFNISSKFDVGLALEPGFCLNNQIALSNKLFTYLTAGLAIVVSETSAQKQFMHAHPSVGKSYKIGDTDAFAKIIDFYFHNRESLMQSKKAALNLARNELNWEIESEKYIIIIKSL